MAVLSHDTSPTKNNNNNYASTLRTPPFKPFYHSRPKTVFTSSSIINPQQRKAVPPHCALLFAERGQILCNIYQTKRKSQNLRLVVYFFVFQWFHLSSVLHNIVTIFLWFMSHGWIGSLLFCGSDWWIFTQGCYSTPDGCFSWWCLGECLCRIWGYRKYGIALGNVGRRWEFK